MNSLVISSQSIKPDLPLVAIRHGLLHGYQLPAITLHTTGRCELGMPIQDEDVESVVPHLDLLDQFPKIVMEEPEQHQSQEYIDVWSEPDEFITLMVNGSGEISSLIYGSLLYGGAVEWSKLIPFLDGLPERIDQVKKRVLGSAGGLTQ